MTDANDHRRAGRLMVEALNLAVDLRGEGGLTAWERAARQVVFLERAAHLWPRQYKAAEVARVLAGFERAWAQLAATRAN